MANIQANVARTAHDKDHVNHLSVPEFGVVEIRIEGSGKCSKSHRDPAYRTKRDPSGKGDDKFCFAPGPQLDETTWNPDAGKTDKVKIIYDLYNPRNAITKAKLELFSRFNDSPVWTRELKDKELLEGEHELEFNGKAEWDGKIDPNAKFPDDYVTVEHSPYKLKVSAEGGGLTESPAAWTYFQVLVEKLELEYGPKKVLPASPATEGTPDHAKTYDLLVAQGAKPPAAGAGPIKVFLVSNLFKTSSGEMFNNAAYTNYETRWKKGPEIPIFCKIWVRNSGGTAVVCPKALGDTKFLWDWESKRAATGDTFVDQAQDYDKDVTKPKGQDCHKDRGGKRGPAADPIFPAGGDSIGGGLFPFKVEVCPAPRIWASYSKAKSTGEYQAKTGVIFQPSRMAGDSYSLTVYVAWDHNKAGDITLNVDTDAPIPAPTQIQMSSGIFEVWRKVYFQKYVKKNAAVTDTVNMATSAALYQPAFLELEDKTGGTTSTAPKAGWNTQIASHFSGLSVTRALLVDTAVDQHSQGPAGVYFRSRNQFYDAMLQHYTKTNLNAALGAPLINAIVASVVGARTVNAYTTAIAGVLAANGYSAVDANSGANGLAGNFTNVSTYMSNAANGVDTNNNHAETCENLAIDATTKAFTPTASATPGCTLFHLMEIHNLTAVQNALLNGVAVDIPGGAGLRAAFLLTSPFSRNAKSFNTVAHEFGHHFFLPHTSDSGEATEYNAHDAATFTTCLMSYNAGRSKFCGFCRLRLRGWSKAALNTAGATNKKP